MYLQDLDRDLDRTSVVLIQTPSDVLKMFLQDKIKAQLNSTQESVLVVDNKKTLKEAQNLSGMIPFDAKKWLFLVNLDKVGVNADLREFVYNNSTGLLFCTTDKYSNYKKFKDMCKAIDNMIDLYITFLKRMDFFYLYYALVPQDNQLPKALSEFILKGYANDINTVMNLLMELNRGTKFESKKSIVDYCGQSGNTVDNLLFSLLGMHFKTERGIKNVIGNRLKSGYELAQSIGWHNLRTYLYSALNAVMDIKGLYIEGTIYKRIENLPDNFNEKKLSRYQRFLWKIKEVPFSDMVRLRVALYECGDWSDESDYLRFLYRYSYYVGKKSELEINGMLGSKLEKKGAD